MPANSVSAEFPPAKLEAVLAEIAELRSHFSFGVSLTPQERRLMIRIGDKTRSFVRTAVEVATENQQLMPGFLDVAEMQRDLELTESLSPVLEALAELQSLIEDTYIAAGTEAYTAARVAYRSARDNSKAFGLNPSVDRLGRRFRKNRKPQSDTPST
ncbi:hypothetical protein [Leptolyngbya sp. FACHB-261]|uniref:hypothetical protein n=1 Tax=Leptolyngbya sp. FACHB-261 TaxID=2692806 RepID=UPI0016842BC1|nr:hypothetical protein [Leptolyngbya sp. FACHB-261]MBD2100057.1 hypothetical protein [Leptolyngbya sp. FACHB-261]